jgi:hypothetical protein
MYGTIEQEPNRYCSEASAECSATALNNGDDEWRYEMRGDDISKRTICFNFFQAKMVSKKRLVPFFVFFVMMGLFGF